MSYLDQITVGSTTYDLQDSDAQRKTITGSGAPTSSTVGEVGLHYFNTSATAPPYEYVCTAASGSAYTWMPAGYGEDGDPGVYYGTSTPPSGTLVWVDPSGDPDGAAIPSGGSVGQVLKKRSGTDYDIEWGAVEALPSGGSAGQVLKKKTTTDYDVEWGAVEALPSGGTIGQLLAKKTGTDYDIEWVNPPPGSVTDVTVNGTSVVTGGIAEVDVVHVGTTAPSDSSINLWLDTDDVGNSFVTTVNGATGNVILDTVHVGTSAPMDSHVRIWYDTDEQGVSAVNSVNGKNGTVVLDADDVGGMSKWVLLWENASPSSAFAAQTVSLDLSSYAFVAIEIGTGGSRFPFAIIPTDSQTHQVSINFDAGGSTFYLGFRSITASSSDIIFGNGRYVYRDGGNGSSNDQVKPITIYGIKGVNNGLA